MTKKSQLLWEWVGVIFFVSVWFLYKKKVTKPIFFKKKKTETGSNRPVSVRFGFLGQKPVWLGFFDFGSVFSGLTRFFSGLAQFFFPVFFGLGSVRFFRFQAYKTETKPVSFFKILIGFFHSSVFPVFFLQFSRFNRFFGFFSHS